MSKNKSIFSNFKSTLRSGVKSEFLESALDDAFMYNYYYERIVNLALSCFEWEGFPDTVDTRYLEYQLFYNPQVTFFKEDVIGDYLVLKCAMNGELDVYGYPTGWTAIGENGYSKELKSDECVIIYNDLLHSSCLNACRIYATRLASLDRTIDINLHAQRTPILIACDENDKLTMTNLYKQYAGGEPVIYGYKALRPDSIRVLKTDAPFLCDKLNDMKSVLWNELLTYLGISNVNIIKKERLVSDEVLRNQGGTVFSRYSRLETRQIACDQINKMFGLNVSVKYRENIDKDVNNLASDFAVRKDDEEGETNE